MEADIQTRLHEANQAALSHLALAEEQYIDYLYTWHIANSHLNHTFITSVPGLRLSLEEMVAKIEAQPAHSSNSRNGTTVLYLMDDAVVRIRSGTYTSITITVTSSSPAKAREVANRISSLFPPNPESDEKEHAVNMRFWFKSVNGPSSWDKKIAVPEWEDIAANYPKRETVAELLEVNKPHGTGKLIVWHGPPGTGKTYAIRSLAWQWRNWCKTQYISDPEAFFAEPAYMMHVLMQENGRFDATEPMYEEDDEGALIPIAQQERENWQLLICEDVGELMAKDAKVQSGQALSRVLNLTEGLIGQGMNTLLLFTTNERLTDLHPAVARPGRCLNEIEFRPFTAPEANSWLTAHEYKGEPVRDSKTLGDLYNIVSHTQVGSKAARDMGFRR